MTIGPTPVYTFTALGVPVFGSTGVVFSNVLPSFTRTFVLSCGNGLVEVTELCDDGA